jgi:hypothetical protein
MAIFAAVLLLNRAGHYRAVVVAVLAAVFAAAMRGVYAHVVNFAIDVTALTKSSFHLLTASQAFRKSTLRSAAYTHAAAVNAMSPPHLMARRPSRYASRIAALAGTR